MSKPSYSTLLPEPKRAPFTMADRLTFAALGAAALVVAAALAWPQANGLKRAIEAERTQAQAPRPCGQATIAQGGR